MLFLGMMLLEFGATSLQKQVSVFPFLGLTNAIALLFVFIFLASAFDNVDTLFSLLHFFLINLIIITSNNPLSFLLGPTKSPQNEIKA